MKDSWRQIIQKYNQISDFSTDKILDFINNKRQLFEDQLEIYPSNENIFRAFNFCDINDIKVVILGQDPYHAPNQANGLCFAINNGISVPPSLRNITNELKNDLKVQLVDTTLENWAQQGVLLLNASLSVVQGQPLSHMKLWTDFTNYIISELNNQTHSIVFVAW